MRDALAFLAIAVAAVSHCSTDHIAGGGGSDVGNGVVTGVIMTHEGRCAAHALIQVIPSDYNPGNPIASGPLPSTVADSAGAYQLGALKEGFYSLQAQSPDDGTRLLVQGIHLTKDSASALRTDTLSQPGSIRIALPAYVDTGRGYLYVPGTTIVASLRSTRGEVVMDSVPSTIISSICYAEKNVTGNTIIRHNVGVASGMTTVVNNPLWAFTRRIYLNTTASGAAITGNVMHFPVLLRFTKSNFNFSEARPDGKDLRFTKPDNTLYPYEIERWDGAAGYGEVWVLADTIFGNDSAHYFTVYWGNDSVSTLSNGIPVFDTADHFTGVWHLREEAAGRGNTAVYLDATANGNQGRDDIAATGRDGIIGFGKNFSNAIVDSVSPQCDEIILPPSVRFVKDSTAALTLSMWLKISGVRPDINRLFTLQRGDTVGTSISLGIFKGDSVSLTLYTYPPRYPAYYSITLAAWHHAAISYTAGQWRLYLDGRMVDGDTASMHESGGLGNAAIGGLGDCRLGERGFDGALDEVRCERIARSDDWILLCYLNQKADNTLVVFK